MSALWFLRGDWLKDCTSRQKTLLLSKQRSVYHSTRYAATPAQAGRSDRVQGMHMAYVIKRYANRKLYDPQESQYVTLEELAEMIRAGKEISVIDVTTGEDLTSVVLAQILLEKERQHQTALPTGFLHQLIQHGAAWQDFALSSMKRNLEGLMSSQREADQVLRQWAAQCGWPWPSQPTAKAPPEKSDEIESLKHEVATLREQLEALSARLDQQQNP